MQENMQDNTQDNMQDNMLDGAPQKKEPLRKRSAGAVFCGKRPADSVARKAIGRRLF